MAMVLYHFSTILHVDYDFQVSKDFHSQSIQDAQCLANQVEMFYCNPSPSKKELLETFTFKPQEFKHQDLISIMENISLLTEATVAAKTEQSKQKNFSLFRNKMNVAKKILSGQCVLQSSQLMLVIMYRNL